MQRPEPLFQPLAIDVGAQSTFQIRVFVEMDVVDDETVTTGLGIQGVNLSGHVRELYQPGTTAKWPRAGP